MKKFLLSAFVVVSFATYSLHQKLDVEEVPPVVVPTSRPPTNQSVGFKDGSYTGSVADAYYGNVQVKITITSGKISDVQFLDYPQDRRTSMMINSQAMPLLKSEAIQAQSAQVDVVSGATQTSRAFKESLQSALDKAK